MQFRYYKQYNAIHSLFQFTGNKAFPIPHTATFKWDNGESYSTEALGLASKIFQR